MDAERSSEICTRKFFDETVRRASACYRFFVFGVARRDGKLVPSCLCCFWHETGFCNAVQEITSGLQLHGKAASRIVLSLAVQKEKKRALYAS